ncbi:hypothetical protein O7599_24180 [Streptomyces sp. WMMC500]|uniref:hypothetical protein n=1 Tax=Streptomyces sp. WMMC500 TaxID=3015154 RepID=UPI00248C28D3|nr:hypothetical protein [Streptomyces sp. WMMC500]WBB58708.1 hypothetical protein O7599_24180 [Streptomyces sp. WMMC500]
MRGVRSAVGAVAVLGLIAGCGGDSGGDGGSGDPGKAGAEAGAEADGGAAAGPVGTSPVPQAYDGAEGWSQPLEWLAGSTATATPVTVAPRADTVAYLLGTSDASGGSGGYTVEARDARSGDLRWSSGKWTPPPPAEDPSADGAPTVPSVATVVQDGREYVVVWAHGMEGKDELHDGKEVVRLAVFPADGSGDATAPARQVSVPVDAPTGVQVRDGGDGALVTWEPVGSDTYGVSVDLTTGESTAFGYEDLEMPQCGPGSCIDGKVVGAGGDGPVVSMASGGFGVPGGWFNEDFAPEGVWKDPYGDEINGRVTAASPTHVAAAWRVGEGGFDADYIWSVHDARTGELRAEVDCDAEDVAEQGSVWERGSGRTPEMSVSPGGRYAAAGPAAFDLKTGEGVCLAGDGDRKDMHLLSVTDDGTGYGFVTEETEGPQTAVQVDLATGDPEALPDGTDLPYRPLRDTALFLPLIGGGDTPAVQVLHRR